MVELEEPLATLWRGKDAFAEVKKLNGEVFRELETRRTLRFETGRQKLFPQMAQRDDPKGDYKKSALIADARFRCRQRVARYSSTA